MQTTRGTSLGGPGASTEPGSNVIVDRRRHVGVLFAVAAFVIGADIVSPIIVVDQLSGRPPVRLLDGLLTLDVASSTVSLPVRDSLPEAWIRL